MLNAAASFQDPAALDVFAESITGPKNRLYARDAMADGGSLTFQTENVYLDRGYATSMLGATPGEYILLTVADTGHGMDAETLERDFEPLFTTKVERGGSGLGLAIVSRIVGAHGGAVEFLSGLGDEGTTVSIVLPIAGPGLDQPSGAAAGIATQNAPRAK